MKIQLLLSMATVGLSNVINFRSGPPPANSTFIQCHEGTTDPICQMIRQPAQDVITEITHPNGTTEIKRNKYTRAQLEQIRLDKRVVSVKRMAGEPMHNGSAEFVAELNKREGPPQLCYHETQKWYDTYNWGYWYRDWRQVGNCFYCNPCTESIAFSFAVAQTWTYQLGIKFDDVVTATFGFSWGQTFTLQDTRTCQWVNNEHGCHSIWYQPLMSYHNGYANYQTHSHCYPRGGMPGGDSYYDHNYAWANVNQAGNNGVNQGNLGCNSGCGGSDHRQCVNKNFGGSLWPYAN
ncbi:hypothetical protein NQ176_g4806 [Zarea fungicola]|uniref:Uncharacterized protein n=1 Tax=Zarea fungicola TaxID=93591 RepID=A0ACC1NCV6_9HYPO|nr:hypothetical protein NQ176_g4806 [Lecanicillium fungicola]